MGLIAEANNGGVFLGGSVISNFCKMPKNNKKLSRNFAYIWLIKSIAIRKGQL